MECKWEEVKGKKIHKGRCGWATDHEITSKNVYEMKPPYSQLPLSAGAAEICFDVLFKINETPIISAEKPLRFGDVCDVIFVKIHKVGIMSNSVTALGREVVDKFNYYVRPQALHTQGEKLVTILTSDSSTQSKGVLAALFQRIKIAFCSVFSRGTWGSTARVNYEVKQLASRITKGIKPSRGGLIQPYETFALYHNVSERLNQLVKNQHLETPPSSTLVSEATTQMLQSALAKKLTPEELKSNDPAIRKIASLYQSEIHRQLTNAVCTTFSPILIYGCSTLFAINTITQIGGLDSLFGSLPGGRELLFLAKACTSVYLACWTIPRYVTENYTYSKQVTLTPVSAKA